jgi:crotonobetainyl-CoA:carnitine CoA-transferase CaiB-like acyl-CoA transferase
MDKPMQGVRILEIAQFTFVPAAAAVLSDWGAEVIKVEHAVTGDAQRGLVSLLGLDVGGAGGSFFPIMEGPNRGKRSIGLALDKPEARPVLEELIRRSDVFLTNYLPSSRKKLGIDVEDVRRINPDIVYVRGSGFGVRGDEADKGGYDSTAFWARGGSAAHVTLPDAEQMAHMPAGGYGDSIGGMTIAGGICAALFARATTGETSIVDVSLLGVGAWAMQFAVNLALVAGGPLPESVFPRHGAARNPLSGTYKTADNRWLMLTMLQPGKYWAEFCTVIEAPELIDDPRFNTVDKLMDNAPQAGEIIAGVLRTRPFEEWIKLFDAMSGQWAAVQDAWEVSQDRGLRANGLISTVIDYDGKERELLTNPVQFDERPQQLTRAPQFAEHTDQVLAELGISPDQAIELKIAGAVT